MVALVVALVAVATVMHLSPLKSVDPYLIAIDEKTGITEKVEPVSRNEYAANEAVDRFFVSNYLRARETYNFSILRYNYNLVRVMSTSNVYSEFRRSVDASADDSLAAILGADRPAQRAHPLDQLHPESHPRRADGAGDAGQDHAGAHRHRRLQAQRGGHRAVTGWSPSPSSTPRSSSTRRNSSSTRSASPSAPTRSRRSSIDAPGLHQEAPMMPLKTRLLVLAATLAPGGAGDGAHPHRHRQPDQDLRLQPQRGLRADHRIRLPEQHRVRRARDDRHRLRRRPRVVADHPLRPAPLHPRDGGERPHQHDRHHQQARLPVRPALLERREHRRQRGADLCRALLLPAGPGGERPPERLLRRRVHPAAADGDARLVPGRRAPAPQPSYPPAASAPASIGNLPAATGYNYRYTYSGPTGIAPVKIYDDGRTTYFKFSGATMPQFAVITASGEETSVPARAAGPGLVAVDAIAPRFSLRALGQQVIVYNEAGGA